MGGTLMCNILTAYSFYKLMVLFPVRSFNSNSHVCQHLVWPLQIILKLYIIFSRCIMIRDLRFIMSVRSRPTFSVSTMSSFTIKSGGSWKVTITGFTMLAVVFFRSLSFVVAFFAVEELYPVVSTTIASATNTGRAHLLYNLVDIGLACLL